MLKFLRVLFGQIRGFRAVFGNVIEFPPVLVKVPFAGQRPMGSGSVPAVLPDAARAHHLVALISSLGRPIRVGVKAVAHRNAVYRVLLHAAIRLGHYAAHGQSKWNLRESQTDSRSLRSTHEQEGKISPPIKPEDKALIEANNLATARGVRRRRFVRTGHKSAWMLTPRLTGRLGLKGLGQTFGILLIQVIIDIKHRAGRHDIVGI
jgi:hypothetical protein